MATHKDLARKIEDLERNFQEKFQEHDKKIILIFNAIKELLSGKAEAEKNRGPMGFIPPRPPDVGDHQTATNSNHVAVMEATVLGRLMVLIDALSPYLPHS